MQKPKPDPDLAYGLKFTGDDLESNRDGVMSEAQQEYLKGYRAIQILMCGALIIVTLLFAGLVIWMFSTELYYANLLGPRPLTNFLLICGIGVFFVGGLILVFLRNMNIILKITDDIRLGEVEAVNGKVILDARMSSFAVGSTKFTVPRREGFLRFKHLEPYIVYYAPSSRIVVSAEPVEK